MTSNRSNNLTHNQRDIRIDSLDPNFIVLPLPVLQTDSAPMQLFFLVTNESFHGIPYVYGTLSLELRNSARQIIQPQQLGGQDATANDLERVSLPLHGIYIPPRKMIVESCVATLFWRNNSLQLQINIAETVHPTHSQRSWLFTDLSPGTYQMQLSYTRPACAFTLIEGIHEIPCSAITTTTTYSPLIELRLVEQDSSGIEVESIYFETIVPTETVTIPPPQSGIQVPLQVELHINNRSSTPYCFSSYAGNLIVDVIGKDGPIARQPATGTGGGLVGLLESDFHRVMPGETMSLPATAFLSWQTESTLALRRRGGVGDGALGGWTIDGLELDRYLIRVTYRSFVEQNFLTTQPCKDFWTGMVHTPFREVELALS